VAVPLVKVVARFTAARLASVQCPVV